MSFVVLHATGLMQVTLGFLLTIVFTYPMSNFAMRICLHYLLCGETQATTLQHFLETLLPFGVVLIGALYVTNLGIVYSLMGAVAACSFFLLFPTAMYLASKRLQARSTVSSVCAVATFAFGIVLLAFGVVTSVMGA